jgi:hypothetical protein
VGVLRAASDAAANADPLFQPATMALPAADASLDVLFVWDQDEFVPGQVRALTVYSCSNTVFMQPILARGYYHSTLLQAHFVALSDSVCTNNAANTCRKRASSYG